MCPHQFGPVCTGGQGFASVARDDTGWQPTIAYEGEVVTCPWHGLEFLIRTGQSLAYPDVKLRTYPVQVVGDEIQVQL
jgi:nitrite reductase/ring-hydroxylating ferredoxin subunit